MTKALIIGGGIAGAVTAMALQKAGITSEIHEAYDTGADDIGAFLTIMRNGMNALHAVDAHQPVIDAGFPATDVEYLDGSGTRITLNPMRGGAQTLKRSVLYRVLHDETTHRGIPLHHGKRLVLASIVDGVVHAQFKDGSTAEGDLLVGADGIHSATRAIIDPDSPAPRFTGLTIAYGYTKASSFQQSADAYRMIAGSRAFFGYTTAPDGETWWFARAPELDLSTATKQNFVDLLAGDNTPAAEIVRSTDDLFINNAYDVPETRHWYNDSMVLVGDAAHAASPASGQGASLALEDSVILAKCLRDIADTRAAFEKYTEIRRARVERLVAESAEQGSNPNRRAAVPRPEDRHWLYDYEIDWNEAIA
ncbi:FAD-dependent monooxygenase [Kibdelosporangium philippinense]|uniref:FAD-dependent monooxygenase n=1 Tax=Kibdelosporangium philippinense TaxID=211113 RepID=A0ABS8ZHQ1_9PSEU|nr:FAD-dependent monooxygenase [Kibdelosporangium philippinense]MCE7006445.1 FAD-dependent monooxygenase [Kibdelosporangium philippinense]